VNLEFTPDGIAELARIATQVNEQTENIGARRLHTVLERLLEEVSFEAPERAEPVRVDRAYVHERLGSIAGNTDLSSFIL
jgi:ATP-dependent HslUV protease ATP-binding subunit HslU